MKKTICNIIAVCSILCLSLLSLVSCKQPYTEKKEVFSPQPQYGVFYFLDFNNSITWCFEVALTPDENGIRVQCVPTNNLSPADNFFDSNSFGWNELSVTCNGITHNSSNEERAQGYVDFIYPFTARKCGETFEFKVNYGAPSLTLTCLANGGCGSLVKPSEIDDMEVVLEARDGTDKIKVRTTLFSPNSITCLDDLSGSNFDVTSVYYQVYPVQNGSIDWSICRQNQIDDNHYFWMDYLGQGFFLIDNATISFIKEDLNVNPREYTGAYAQYAFKVHPNTSIPEIDNVEFEIASVNGQAIIE